MLYIDMATHTHARLFWSGGSQAVRLPKAMRFPGKEVVVRRRGAAVILEPLPEADDWSDFWDRLIPLARPVRRWKTRPVERRAPL
jgi:virulence-associated protein VagC